MQSTIAFRGRGKHREQERVVFRRFEVCDMTDDQRIVVDLHFGSGFRAIDVLGEGRQVDPTVKNLPARIVSPGWAKGLFGCQRIRDWHAEKSRVS